MLSQNIDKMQQQQENLEAELQQRLGAAVGNDTPQDPNSTSAKTTQQPQSHGYGDVQNPANLPPEAHIHPSLRSAPTTQSFVPTATMMPAPMTAPVESPVPGSVPGAIPGGVPGTVPPQMVPAPQVAASVVAEPPTDGRKQKRELSQSKRAAQNRAAQRAFRQRKEGYIKKLEQQVKDYEEMEKQFKAREHEIYQLRDYIINLQSRLLASQGEYPPPPQNLNLPAPGAQAPSVMTESAQRDNSNALEAIAQAVAGLPQPDGLSQDAQGFVKADYNKDPQNDDVRTEEEISRQLQAEVPPM